MENLTFTIPDILLLLGVAQCLYIIVYLAFRSGRLSRGGVPLVYFITLAAAFTAGFLVNTLPELFSDIAYLKPLIWSLQYPLCVLLIIQVAQIYKAPSWGHYWVVLLVPLAYVAAHYLSTNDDQFEMWLRLNGLVAGTISFMSLWFSRKTFTNLTNEKNHKERYWLVLALLFTNAAFIATLLFHVGMESDEKEIDIITTLFGLVLVYLSSTSLFRIYPQAVDVNNVKKPAAKLSVFEASIATKIKDLMRLDKVYQEPSYSRADMARECEAPEAVVSKVLNAHFGQSFPQLMNQARISEAKDLLMQTDEAMAIIAKESGFNSLASFNRVFKELLGMSPSQFRSLNK